MSLATSARSAVFCGPGVDLELRPSSERYPNRLNWIGSRARRARIFHINQLVIGRLAAVTDAANSFSKILLKDINADYFVYVTDTYKFLFGNFFSDLLLQLS